MIKENTVKYFKNKEQLQKNFEGFSQFGKVFYPLKASENISILKDLNNLINKQGGGFLISHPKHLNTLQKIGVEYDKIALINVLTSNKIIKHLYNKGVRFFVFDNFESVKNFAKYADLKQTKIAVRLTPETVFTDVHSHMGSTQQETEEILTFLNGKCSSLGISFYLHGSLKEDTGAINKMLAYISDNFTKFNPDFVSIGGIPKFYKMPKLNCKIKNINLEPGNYLLDGVLDMQTKIVRLALHKDSCDIAIANGIYSGFLDILLYNHQFNFLIEDKPLKNKREKETDIRINLYGGSSDTNDKLGIYYLDAENKDVLQQAEYMNVKNIGGYADNMYVEYCGDFERITYEI